MQVFSTLCLALAAVVAVAKGAGVDPGLPDAKPTVPGWYFDESNTYTAQFQYYNSPSAIASLPTQDYAVIGGGWSGVSTANWLAKLGGASKSIALLEARGISDGASGRNLGWMAPRSFVHYNSSVQSVGKANTLQQVYFERQIAEEVFNLTLTLPVLPGVSEILRTGRFLVYTTVVQSEFNQALADYNLFRKDSGLTDQIYFPAQQCHSLFPTVDNLAGCFWISEHYRLRTPTLVWALFNNMMSTYSNVHAYTRAPVTKITSAGTGSSKLYTIYVNNTAMLKAKNIAFTANAWTSHLLPALQFNTSAPYFIFSAQQQVLQSNPLYPVFTGYACVEFADDVYGLWQRESGAFINAQGFGFLNSSDSGIDPSQVTGPIDETGQQGGGALTFLQTVYPKDASAKADHVWTGVQGFTSDSQPFVGPLQASNPTLWISSGFNGHGNPRAYGCGRALAQQMLGMTVSPALPNVYQTQTRAGFYNWALTGATFN